MRDACARPRKEISECGTGNEIAHFGRMSYAQLDHIMNALEGKVVQILLVATIVVGLLSIFLKWLHHALFRDRSARNADRRGSSLLG
jgi:hypothetical protein